MADHGNPEWDIIVVAHNSADTMARCWSDHGLDGIANIIVIDNESTDSSSYVARTFAHRVERMSNDGLSWANNRGAWLGTAPRLLFCNPDVQVTRGDLERLAQILDQYGGIAAPRLVESDGQLQPNARSFPTPARQLARRVNPGGERAREYLWPPTDGVVDWVTGACVAVSRIDFARVGGWPTDYFLYFEDVEFCARARDAGLQIRLVEDVQVLHLWNRESKKLLSRAGRLHLASALRYYRGRVRDLARL
jgi:N-acetylglucosaminyl-diphospho-decaprenol L-rhamnosyltransferase